MSVTSQARPDDPRVARSRAAAIEAARTLFLRQGYVGTTMDDVAALAGLSKRTLYNNYADKGELFKEIVEEVVERAEHFAMDLPAAFEDLTTTDLSEELHDLGRRLALGILRPEVIALRRLLIGEARSFPDLAADYFDRAPGRVMDKLASAFAELSRAGLLRPTDTRRAAEQFAYLVAGAPLDRAILLGAMPTEDQVISCARDGVETFLARFGAEPPRDLD